MGQPTRRECAGAVTDDRAAGPQVLCHCRKCQTLTGSHYAHDIGFAPEHVRSAVAPPFLLLHKNIELLRDVGGSCPEREACMVTALYRR